MSTRQRMGEAVIGQAYALKTRALVKLCELLEALPNEDAARALSVSLATIKRWRKAHKSLLPAA